jgi:hypothetical protein
MKRYDAPYGRFFKYLENIFAELIVPIEMRLTYESALPKDHGDVHAPKP